MLSDERAGPNPSVVEAVMRPLRGRMRHLGVLRGSGTLSCDGVALGRAEFEIDGFCTMPGEVVGSGEIRMAPADLDRAFGRDLVLTTDDGRVLTVRFSGGSRRGATDGAAHADVVAGLPAADQWRR
jgi:hypothetical protein